MGAIDRPVTPPSGDSAGPLPADRPPPWRFPVPFGRGPATETTTGIAAPLLAGFSLALLGVVAQNPDYFRLPGAALLALTATTILMVASVQFGFRARTFLYSAADVSAWWPEPRPPAITAALRRQQAGHFEQWLRSSNRARLAYNAAVVTLAFGVGLVLAPPEPRAAQPAPPPADTALRWTASGLAGLAGLVELGWAVRDRARRRRVPEGRTEGTEMGSPQDAPGPRPAGDEAAPAATTPAATTPAAIWPDATAPDAGAPNSDAPTPAEVPNDQPVTYGVDIVGIAPSRQVDCRHGFDPAYCPFGCS